MKNTTIIGCLAAVLGAFGAPTMGEDGGKYVIDVLAGETYALTADDVAAIGALPLVKAGEGTLTVDDVLADYDGDIYILDGQYKATAATSFGTTNGVTYVDGGTLWSTVAAPTTYTADGGHPSYGSEAFHLKGTGYNNLGAIRQTDNDSWNFAAKGGVTLDGDIRVTGTKALEFRYQWVNCNGHTITVAMDAATVLFRFVSLTVRNPGSVVVESGRFGFESGTGTGSATHSVTVEPGCWFYLQNALENQQRTLWLKDGARMEIGRNGTLKPGEITNMNRWSGAVTVDGNVPVQFDAEGRTFNLSAPISGAGGFAAYGGGYVQFANTNNTFAGGVCATGKVGAVAGVVTGGVSVVKTETTGNTYMTPFVAIPTNGAPIRITNAQLGVFDARFAELPDVYADGRCCVTGDPMLVKGTLKSLTKTGADALTLSGPIHVAGATDVRGGTLRFGTRVPDVPAGLNWYYSWGVTRGSDKAGVPANVPFRKVEPTGAAYAYTGWPSTTGADGASTHNQAHYYTGYVRIPGEEGENVTCSFITCIARYVHLRIDGTLVADQRDNKNWITGTGVTTDYNRLTVTGPYTFKAGWRSFELYLGNGWNGTAGPKMNNLALNWPYDFGVGVDWQGRCVTNSANYVKFLDPGDGSFLRPTLESKAGVDPASYPRPSFGGAVAFGPGTTFDMGDVTPYTPVTVPALSGCPAIANGALVVSNSWTVSHAQAVAQPLTVAAGAKLTFAAGTALAIDDIELFSRKPAGTPLVVAEEADAITGLPALTGVGKGWKLAASEDGRSLVLRDISGTVLLFR